MRELQVTEAILGVSADDTIDLLILAQRAWIRVWEVQKKIDLITGAQKKLT